MLNSTRVNESSDVHLALKLVSVKLSGFALALPTFNFAFYSKLATKKGFTSGASASLEIFLFLLLLSRAGTHLDLTTTTKSR